MVSIARTVLRMKLGGGWRGEASSEHFSNRALDCGTLFGPHPSEAELSSDFLARHQVSATNATPMSHRTTFFTPGMPGDFTIV